MPSSNNPNLSNTSVMALEYLDLDTIRTKLDSTVSGGISPSLGTPLLNGTNTSTAKASGTADTTVVHMNPFFSIQSIDLYMRDEYGNYLQNFRSPSGYTLEYNSEPPALMEEAELIYSGNYIYSLIEGENSFNNGIFTIPAWLAALNPNTSGGNTQPLIGPFSTYLTQCLYGIFAISSTNSVSQPSFPASGVSIPPDFSPTFPNSANLIHFGRVLGY
jgi:hypothetical protein